MLIEHSMLGDDAMTDCKNKNCSDKTESEFEELTENELENVSGGSNVLPSTSRTQKSKLYVDPEELEKSLKSIVKNPKMK